MTSRRSIRLALLPFLGTALLASPVAGQESDDGVGGFQSAGDLLRKCRESSTFGRSYCFAYLAAAADTARAYRVWLGPVDPCLPPDITLGRLADIFESFLVDNPSLTDSQAASVIVASLQYHFPCEPDRDENETGTQGLSAPTQEASG